MSKIKMTSLLLLICITAFGQRDRCWKVSDERKQRFINFAAEKADDLEIYLKATANGGSVSPTIYFIRRDAYKTYLLASKKATSKTLLDTLKAQVKRGITLNENEALLFKDYVLNRKQTYDSLKSRALSDVLMKYFSPYDGALFPQYYYDYSHLLALVLYDNYILFQYSLSSGIAAPFYIDLARSGCFKK